LATILILLGLHSIQQSLTKEENQWSINTDSSFFLVTGAQMMLRVSIRLYYQYLEHGILELKCLIVCGESDAIVTITDARSIDDMAVEFQLHAKLVTQGINDPERMALEWVKHVDVAEGIFPKLPVYLRNHRERFDRNE
jgi:hypothetical protein